MEFDWMQIGRVALLVMFLVVLYPAAKWWAKNSPKAGKGDWTAAILPLVGVVLFVALLIMLVRG
jgi:hypothetical protein